MSETGQTQDDLVKVLRAMAQGTFAKTAKHDVILEEAADRLIRLQQSNAALVEALESIVRRNDERGSSLPTDYIARARTALAQSAERT